MNRRIILSIIAIIALSSLSNLQALHDVTWQNYPTLNRLKTFVSQVKKAIAANSEQDALEPMNTVLNFATKPSLIDLESKENMQVLLKRQRIAIRVKKAMLQELSALFDELGFASQQAQDFNEQLQVYLNA